MKTKIRNIFLLSFALILVLGSCLALFGCGGSEYTLTFDPNYEGAKVTNVGVNGGSFDMPDDPERDGYVFSGWYEDADCTTEFDFDGISEDATVYAGWIVRRAGYLYVTLSYNLTGYGTYKVVEVETASVAREITDKYKPTLAGYKFIGWYSDAACSTAIESSDIINSNTTFYASWYIGWTFEAEYTNLYKSDGTMRDFNGYSENGKPIKSDSSCSNGQYVGNLYKNECYIEFEITCSADVDATISLRAAMEYGWYDSNMSIVSGNDVTISDDEFALRVNGDDVSYTAMKFSGAAALSKSGTHTSFSMYDLATISLKSGSNTIRLVVDNDIKGEGGTQLAAAPLIDYMMLYVPDGVTLTMTEY